MDLENDTFIVKTDSGELCRLCANTDNQLIPIFKGEGIEHNISSKIEKHLPIIKVTEQDKLPLQICYQCASTLIAWHNLYEGCRIADNRLREILSIDEKLPQYMKDDESLENYTDDFRDDYEEESQNNFVENVQLASISNSSQLNEVQTLGNTEINEHTDTKIFDETENENHNDERKYEKYCVAEEYESTIHVLVDQEHEELQLNDLNNFEDTYCCTVCGLIFPMRKDFEKHICLNLQNDDQCTCDVCNKSFRLKSRLINHIRNAHNLLIETDNQIIRLSNGKFQCPVCTKEFRRKLNANQHFITHVSEKNLNCDKCEFKCYTKTQLDVHKIKHIKRFCCEICSKMFSYKFQLETHVQGVHYNIRPFPCRICGKTFKTRYNHGSHMAQHKDIRNFQCPYCPRKCRKSYDLRIHIRTHTGEKPFQCSYCERSYRQNGDRLKHEKHCYQRSNPSQILIERYPDNEITEVVSLKLESILDVATSK